MSKQDESLPSPNQPESAESVSSESVQEPTEAEPVMTIVESGEPDSDGSEPTEAETRPATPSWERSSDSRPVTRDESARAGSSWIDGLYSATGLLCTLGGLGLVVVASVSPETTKSLESLGNPTVLGAVLALPGALLFGLSRVRRVLASVEHVVSAVRVKTDRIDDVASEGVELRREVGELSTENSALRDEVAEIQTRLVELTEAATNPEIQTSIFQLAASQDQLTKRVDLSMEARVRTLKQEITAEFESFRTAQRELSAAVTALGERTAERLVAHDAQLEHTLEAVQSASEMQDRRLDQVQERLKGFAQDLATALDAMVEGLMGVTESVQRAAGDNASGLELLREQVDQRLSTSANALEGRLDEMRGNLEQRLGQLESGQGRNLHELAESLRAETEQGVVSLRENLENVAHHLRETRTQLTTGIETLATRVEEQLRAETGSLYSGLQEQAQTAYAGLRDEVVRELRGLSARVDEQLNTLETAGASRHDELARWIEEERTQRGQALTEAVSSLGELTRSTGQGLVGDIQQVAQRLEQLLEVQAEVLEESLHVSIQTSQQTSARLDSGLTAISDRLAHGVSRLDDGQSLLLSELTAQLEQDHARSERALQEGLEHLTPAIAAELRAQLDALQATLQRAEEVVEESADWLPTEIQTPDLFGDTYADQSQDRPAVEYADPETTSWNETTGSDDAMDPTANTPVHLDPTTPLAIDPDLEPPAPLPGGMRRGNADESADQAPEFGAWIDSYIDHLPFDKPSEPYGSDTPERRPDEPSES